MRLASLTSRRDFRGPVALAIPFANFGNRVCFMNKVPPGLYHQQTISLLLILLSPVLYLMAVVVIGDLGVTKLPHALFLMAWIVLVVLLKRRFARVYRDTVLPGWFLVQHGLTHVREVPPPVQPFDSGLIADVRKRVSVDKLSGTHAGQPVSFNWVKAGYNGSDDEDDAFSGEIVEVVAASLRDFTLKARTPAKAWPGRDEALSSKGLATRPLTEAGRDFDLVMDGATADEIATLTAFIRALDAEGLLDKFVGVTRQDGRAWLVFGRLPHSLPMPGLFTGPWDIRERQRRTALQLARLFRICDLWSACLSQAAACARPAGAGAARSA